MSPLSSSELKYAQNLIDTHPSGKYEIKVLYGNEWRNVVSPTTFGKRFLQAVREHKLSNIKSLGFRSDNHNEYLIGKERL